MLYDSQGRGRELNQHSDQGILVDGLTHAGAAKMFNQAKYFVCYDEYTMYASYAALCGCTPVVVPRKGVKKEEWRPEYEQRYGVAYGWDDVTWAEQTRDLLKKRVEHSLRKNEESVKNFIEIVEERAR